MSDKIISNLIKNINYMTEIKNSTKLEIAFAKSSRNYGTQTNVLHVKLPPTILAPHLRVPVQLPAASFPILALGPRSLSLMWETHMGFLASDFSLNKSQWIKIISLSFTLFFSLFHSPYLSAPLSLPFSSPLLPFK